MAASSRSRCQLDRDWLLMAGAVVTKMRVGGAMYEEAVQETALAGWIAAERWTPDGGMSLRNWTWQAMERGLVDWLRGRLGRKGQRIEWENSLRHLDEPLHVQQRPEDVRTLGDAVPACDHPYDTVEDVVDLEALIVRAALTEQEARWVRTIRDDEPQKPLMDVWHVSEGRVSQIKHCALRKLRAAAIPDPRRP